MITPEKGMIFQKIIPMTEIVLTFDIGIVSDLH